MNASAPSLSISHRLARVTRPVVVAMAAVLVAVSPTAAHAPERIPIDFTNLSTDAEVCASYGFAIDVVEHGYGFLEVFTDASGDFTRAMLHLTVDYTLTGNGVTVRERDRK